MILSKRAPFELVSLISQNDLCQSWEGVSRETGRRCFIKTANPESDLDEKSSSSILANSFDCQRRLTSSRIVTARGKHYDKGRLFVEYPYLDSSEWKELTPSLFWHNVVSVLTQICTLVDLIHIQGLAHCDLKLGNFLVTQSTGGAEVTLVDLDFLTQIGSSPGAKVFGSPRHIAPEILANDSVVAQSDNFSLGVALQLCLEHFDQHAGDFSDVPAEEVQGIKRLAESLTAEYSMHRPYCLLEALHKNGIVDDAALDSANRTIISSQLLAGLREIRRVGASDVKTIRRIILEKNNILGIPRELVEDLIQLYAKSPADGVRRLKSIIQSAELSRLGDYWRVRLTDEFLTEMFNDLDRVLGRESLPVSDSEEFDVGRLLDIAGQFRSDDRIVRAFLSYKMAIERLPLSGVDNLDDRLVALKNLAELARSLNRLEDAAEFYGSLVDLNDAHSRVDLESHRRLVVVLMDIGRTDRVDSLIEEGIEMSRSRGDSLSELEYLRSKASLASARGNHEEAERIFDFVNREAERHGFTEFLISSKYNLGVMCWRKGLFSEAEAHLMEGLRLSREEGIVPKAVKTMSLLAGIHHERGEYAKALRMGKTALKYISSTGDTSPLPYLSLVVAVSCSRLGDHKDAEFWLTRMLAPDALNIDGIQMLSFYATRGSAMNWKGDIAAAKILLRQALDLSEHSRQTKVEGKIYHNLAEIAMYQGDAELCEECLAKGRAAIADQGDEASLAELDIIEMLNSYYNAGADEALLSLVPVVKKLVKCNGYYYASLGLFHLLMNTEFEDAVEVAETVGAPVELYKNSEAPLFRVMASLIDLAKSAPNQALTMSVLKSAYRLLDHSGGRFLALVVCRRIAQEYHRNVNNKLARKFYDQAIKLASDLRNERSVQELSLLREGVTGIPMGSTDVIESLHSISEILTNIDDYRDSLDKVIRFAVDQTGAERGVLLLKSENSAELKVAAVVNCDEDSLDDIKDFSSTIPLEVARNVSPLIVEDALSDKRTKDYKSIVVHNILSVICIPISIESKVVGVLYLDHHTIPALFEKDDITYVSSIANLMAVMIATIRSYRDVTLINRQLVEDVGRRGGRQPFVTKDETMLALFDKLPEIARTNASILITGESGTGKEILCEMIHSLSLRHDKPLIKLNCAAIAGTLIESELFGVAGNVATDVKEREGRFSAADSGTLLLDEIGDMPLEVQAKVLRAVEYQQFEKVGSNKTIHTDIRFIYATNRDLSKMVKSGDFRQDLLYRINTVAIEILPLRERRGDIIPLIDHFVGLFSQQGREPRFSGDALEALVSYNWPGNVRELRNIVERFCILNPAEKVSLAALPPGIQVGPGSVGDGKESARLIETQKIRTALSKHNWNQSRVSNELGIPLSTLRRKIKKYSISKPL